MHKSVYVLGNETRKILWDCEMQTNHFMPPRSPELVIVKKNQPDSEFCRSGEPQSEIKENKKRVKYFNLARVLKKL